ncbi:MAG TPA: lipopolysaccharide kinase InaA family protein [Tepidisphaeraceae bacterium]
MIFIAEPYRQVFQTLGFRPEMIFTDPAIKPWRTLPDRENCTWDIQGRAGDIQSPAGDIQGTAGPIRLHVKRFPAIASSHAREEAEGYKLLQDRKIPTALVAAWGDLPDGRSFIAVEDLSGFTPADKLIKSSSSFDQLLAPTASLAAQLHNASLHHRDLYLCHFLARVEKDRPPEIRLIDAARVRKLPSILTRRRWIIKDLSQFWYSTTELPITDSQRTEWLSRYCTETKLENMEPLKRAIQRKSDAIRAHDEKLRRRQPHRNISIPRD